MYIPSRVRHPSFANTQALDRLPMPTIEDMMRLGVAIDIPYLSTLAEEMRDTMEDLSAKVRRRVPSDKLAEFLGNVDDTDDAEDTGEGDTAPVSVASRFKVTSPEQVAWFLFDTLGIGKGKQLVTTPDGSRISTGKKQLEALKQEHEAIQEILAFREVHKLYTTYVLKLPRIARHHPKGRHCPVCGHTHRESSNRVHTTIVATRTDTGRLAGRRPNLMNIPIRSPMGARVRAAFVPSYGMSMVGADYSQIELRILASESADPFMMQCFLEGRDIHAESTLEAMGIRDKVAFDPKSKAIHAIVPGATLPTIQEFMTMRAGMKNANFGIVYGITWMGLQAQLVLIGIYWSKEQTIAFIEETWHKVFAAIRPYMREQEYRARKYGFTWDLMGSVRYIHGIRSAVKRVVAESVRQAGNMPIQSAGSAFLKIAMWTLRGVYERFRDDGYEVNFLMPVHDEIVSECDTAIAEELKAATVECMARVNDYTQLLVPVAAEGKVTSRWTK